MTSASNPREAVPVEALLLPPPVWLDERASLHHVARTMCEAAVSAVIIGPGAAIVTERDVVRALAAGETPDAPALAYSSSGILSLSGEASVAHALAAMLDAGVRHIVIVDAAGVPSAVLPLSAAAAVVLDATVIPNWLSALRIVLRVESPTS
jgi:CBS domain-containing protein